MELLPAIDLLDARVVRLAQGRYDRSTVYSDDPADVARTFLRNKGLLQKPAGESAD